MNRQELKQRVSELLKERKQWAKHFGWESATTVHNPLIRSEFSNYRIKNARKLFGKDRLTGKIILETFKHTDGLWHCRVNGKNIGLGIYKYEAIENAYYNFNGSNNQDTDQ